MKRSAFFALTALAFAGCDYVSAPHQAGTTPGGGGGNGVTRRVLVEEFTGHTCIACPAGSRTLHTIDSLYPGQVMIVGIHTGWFGDPCPPHPLPNGAPSGSFSEDFTCATADDYDVIYNMSGNPPVAMINRLGYPLDYVKQQGNWTSLVDSLLSAPPIADLEFDTVIYNNSTRDLTFTLNGKFIAAQNGTFNVAVMLTEDSLTGWQIDGTQYLPSYTFMHVLRDCVNSPGTSSGVQLATGSITANSTFTWSLPATYNVSSSWNAGRCKLIAFVYNTSTKEVLQAAEAELQ